MSLKLFSLMFNLALATLMAIGFGPILAHAETSDSESSTTIEKVKPESEKNKAPGEDVDETLTNNQMRAQSGSKSKYSIASQIYYYGGSIEKPLAEERPNIGGAPGTTDVAQLNGQISGKYSFDQRHSLMLGVGLRYMTPFYGTSVPGGLQSDGKGGLERIYDGNKLDAENPYITAQYIYKAAGIQNVLTLTPTYYTNSNLTSLAGKRYLASMTLQQVSAYEIPTTKLTVALNMAIQGTGYSEDLPGQMDMGLALDPYMEYQLTDKVNLRTVFNLWNYDHVRSNRWATWSHEALLQSVGVGFAITRDIFLYPNLQFVLDDIRADRTNVALSTFVNLF